MSTIRYATYADILSRINRPPAFISVSNGAVNVDCPRENINGTEKAIEIIDKIIAKLDAYQEESKRIATKYACWKTKIDDDVPELRTPHSSPSQPLDAHHHKSKPPHNSPSNMHNSPSNTTDQNSVILETKPKPVILTMSQPPAVLPPASAPTSAPMPSVSLPIVNGLIPSPTAVLHYLTNHSSDRAAGLNPVVQNTIFSPTPKSQPGFTVRSKDATVLSFFGCFNLLVVRLQHHYIGWGARKNKSTMGCALLDLFCPFPQVRKHEYDPPPDNTTSLGFISSLEDKAVSMAVQLIRISVEEWEGKGKLKQQYRGWIFQFQY